MAHKKRKRPQGEKKLLEILGQAGRPLLLQEVLKLLRLSRSRAPGCRRAWIASWPGGTWSSSKGSASGSPTR